MYQMPIDVFNYAMVPWESDSIESVIVDVQQSLRMLRNVVPNSKSDTLMKSHFNWEAVASIYFSNRIEDAGVSLSDTYLFCSMRQRSIFCMNICLSNVNLWHLRQYAMHTRFWWVEWHVKMVCQSTQSWFGQFRSFRWISLALLWICNNSPVWRRKRAIESIVTEYGIVAQWCPISCLSWIFVLS